MPWLGNGVNLKVSRVSVGTARMVSENGGM